MLQVILFPEWFVFSCNFCKFVDKTFLKVCVSVFDVYFHLHVIIVTFFCIVRGANFTFVSVFFFKIILCSFLFQLSVNSDTRFNRSFTTLLQMFLNTLLIIISVISRLCLNESVFIFPTSSSSFWRPWVYSQWSKQRCFVL